MEKINEEIKMVIFDIAGTTIKDDGLVVRAFENAFREFNPEISDEDFAAAVEYVNQTKIGRAHV